MVERCSVEHAVDEPRGDEEPGRAMQEPPALIPAEDASSFSDTGCVVRRLYDGVKRRRHDRLPARQDRPQKERHQADCPDCAERAAERGAVWARRQQDVWREQRDSADREPAMPDRRAVDAVEPLLHPGQRADQHQCDRQQQNRFAAEKLPDVAPRRFSRRTGDKPEDGHRADQDADRRGPNITGGEFDLHEVANGRLARRQRLSLPPVVDRGDDRIGDAFEQ